MNKFGQNTDQPAVYFNKLYMKNVRCFKGNHEIDLGNGNGEPSQWTVILGNNNVGKTTILRVIASLDLKNEGKEENRFMYRIVDNLMFKNYNTFENKFSLIGNELFIKNGIDFESLRIDRFENNDNKSRYFDSFILENKEWLSQINMSSCILRLTDDDDKKRFSNAFKFFYPNPTESLKIVKFFGYGTSRTMIDSQSIEGEPTQGLFDNKTFLSNVEEWIKELHFASAEIKQAEKRYKQLENILCGGLLPDVSQIKMFTEPDKSSFETFPKFLTSQGWVRLEDLGYGYQATLAWVADLAKRMFDQYPDLENPLHGPAVVLVDEIDLHLHPEWQRKIIKYLSDLFPNTQFIVTAHSPLIIQSAENVNLIMLEKDDNPDGKGINIRQRFGSFQGWTVDEILTELMNLGDRTRSDLYLQRMQDFENAVLEDDYEKAQSAYNQLDKILSPSSYQRKVLQIQMSSLIPVGV
jgi:predicted ATP-binding protein involved in virulence